MLESKLPAALIGSGWLVERWIYWKNVCPVGKIRSIERNRKKEIFKANKYFKEGGFEELWDTTEIMTTVLVNYVSTEIGFIFIISIIASFTSLVHI